MAAGTVDRFAFYIAFVSLVVVILTVTFGASLFRRRGPNHTPLIVFRSIRRKELGPPPELFDAWVSESGSAQDGRGLQWRGMKPITATVCKYEGGAQPQLSSTGDAAVVETLSPIVAPPSPTAAAPPETAPNPSDTPNPPQGPAPSPPATQAPQAPVAPQAGRRNFRERVRAVFLIPTAHEAPFHHTAAAHRRADHTPHHPHPRTATEPAVSDDHAPARMQVSVLIAMPAPQRASDATHRDRDAKAVEAGQADLTNEEKPLGPYMVGIAEIVWSSSIPDRLGT